MSKEKMYAVKNDKGVWLSLDASHESVWYSNNPTLFNDKSDAEAQIIGRKAHVVTLIEEPEKVVLTKEQAKIVEKAHKAGDDDDDEELLMKAYVNGYTVEKEKKYNVKVPHSRFYYWKWKDNEIGVGSGEDDDVCGVEPYRFTESEIEHYGLQDCKKTEVSDDEQ